MARAVKTRDYRDAVRELITNTGDAVDTSVALGTKRITALYFSAHWCGPCKAFTPKLIRFYESHQSEMEVVFVSSDRSVDTFREYFKTMPWLAIPFENDDQIAMLMKAFKVNGIPTLLVFNSSGELLSSRGIDLVTSFPGGFPWLKTKTE